MISSFEMKFLLDKIISCHSITYKTYNTLVDHGDVRERHILDQDLDEQVLDVLQNVVLEQRFWYVWIGLELDHDLDEHVPVVLLDVVLEQRFWYFWIGLEKLDLKHVYHDIFILDFIFCQTSPSTWSWPWWTCACCPCRRRPRATILVSLS